MTIEESNLLIAEFMGFKLNQPSKFEYISTEPYRSLTLAMFISDSEMEFHKSWGWLMPVVEKIWDIIGNRESLFYFDISEHTKIEDRTRTIFSGKEHKDNITDCYNTVVQFIQWYNSHQVG